MATMGALLLDLEGALTAFGKKQIWGNREHSIAKIACQRMVQRIFSTDIGPVLNCWVVRGRIELEVSGSPSKNETSRSSRSGAYTLILRSECYSIDHLVALTWLNAVRWSAPEFNEAVPITILQDDMLRPVGVFRDYHSWKRDQF